VVVDFELKHAKAADVISVKWKGPWDEKQIRKRFEGLAKWADARGVRTGRWFFLEPGERAWEVALEVKGRVKGDGRVRRKRFKAATVASVVFDPDAISPRVIYHGITDWLRWRKKDRTIKSIGAYREIYDANPWTNPKAWAKTNIQVVVKK